MQFLNRRNLEVRRGPAAGRRRDRRHRRRRRRLVRRQEVDDGNLGPGHVAQDGDRRPGDHRRAAAGHRQRAAWRPVDRHAHEVGAVRPLPGGVLRPRRRRADPSSPRRASPTRFAVTVEAFNIAEEYQTPVVVLSDQDIAQRKETVDPIDTSRVRIVDRCVPSEADLERYAAIPRHRVGDQPSEPSRVGARQLPRVGDRAQRARGPHRQRQRARADEREAIPQARAAQEAPRSVPPRRRPERAPRPGELGERRRRVPRGAGTRARRGVQGEDPRPLPALPAVRGDVPRVLRHACAPGWWSSSRTRASCSAFCACSWTCRRAWSRWRAAVPTRFGPRRSSRGCATSPACSSAVPATRGNLRSDPHHESSRRLCQLPAAERLPQ